MDWMFYIFAFVMALAITGSGVLALRWAARTGQLRNFEQNAKTIFDEEEPEGVQTDHFPGRKTPAPAAPKEARTP
jgi:hypothetical protein